MSYFTRAQRRTVVRLWQTTVAGAVAAVVAAGGCTSNMHPEPREMLSTKEIFDRNKPAIVKIESTIGPHEVAYGTGFVVGADGRIATNLHVISRAKKVTVKLLDGTEIPATRVVASDPGRDLAIIAIDKQGLPIIHLGNSDQVSAGDRVVAIGNPLGVFDYTVSDGLISSVRPLGPNVTVLQISAPISQGSSGGPLFNPYGEVIGVATLIAREGQNINFGIPSNYLRPLVAVRGPGQPLAQFLAKLAELQHDTPLGSPSHDHAPILRKVPHHPLSVLKGCSADKVAEIYRAITNAIEVGAPVYNNGQFRACYAIYRDVAAKYEGDDSTCKGVRDAFGAGLLRADAADDDAAKAWAMRDTFDGLLDVIARKVGTGSLDDGDGGAQGGEAAPPAGAPGQDHATTGGAGD